MYVIFAYKSTKTYGHSYFSQNRTDFRRSQLIYLQSDATIPISIIYNAVIVFMEIKYDTIYSNPVSFILSWTDS